MNHQEHHDRITSIRARRDVIIAAAKQAHDAAHAETLHDHHAKIEDIRAELARTAALAAVVTEKGDREAAERESQIKALSELAEETERSAVSIAVEESAPSSAFAPESHEDPEARAALNAAFDPSLVVKLERAPEDKGDKSPKKKRTK